MLNDPIAFISQYGWVLTFLFPLLLSFYFGIKGKPARYLFLSVLISFGLSFFINIAIALTSPLTPFIPILGIGAAIVSVIFPVVGVFLAVASVIFLALSVLIYLIIFGIAYLVGKMISGK